MSSYNKHLYSRGDDAQSKPGLYRWKRQFPSHVYSRSQRVKTSDDIQDWIKKVEDASGWAAEAVLNTKQTETQGMGTLTVQHAIHQLHEEDQTRTEAKELLTEWMKEKVHLNTSNLDLTEEPWMRTTADAEVKRQWDQLLEGNLDSLNKRSVADQYAALCEGDDTVTIANIMHSLMEKSVVKKQFLGNLDLDQSKKMHDPRTKMELRRKQV